MRIRTRLFLGIATLMSLLLGVQYLLYTWQVKALNQELNVLSASVGRSMLEETLPELNAVVMARAGGQNGAVAMVGDLAVKNGAVKNGAVENGAVENGASGTSTAGSGATVVAASSSSTSLTTRSVDVGEQEESGEGHAVVVAPAPPAVPDVPSTRSTASGVSADSSSTPETIKRREVTTRVFRTGEGANGNATHSAFRQWVVVKSGNTDEIARDHSLKEGDDGGEREGATEPDESAEAGGEHENDLQLQVIDDEAGRRMIIKGLPGGVRRFNIAADGATDIVETTGTRILLATSLLLLVSLAGAAWFSHRMSRPLNALVTGAELIGKGDWAHRLAEDSPGEVGELQRAFNRMGEQLTRLEAERQRLQGREHLAELGELARGLAHTLRNPLNTLGLAIEELAREPMPLADTTDSTAPDPRRGELAGVARAQIQRIDRWLRSFLAVGAGNAALPEPVELNALLEGLTLEFLQQHQSLELDQPDERLWIQGVPLALRAALSNLIDNAISASPPDKPARVMLKMLHSTDLEAGPDLAQISILDDGPGLPEQVRAQLFSPHQTTRPGGSGMGLFLSRQIIASGHNGHLMVLDRAEGGTEAKIWLPLLPAKTA